MRLTFTLTPDGTVSYDVDIDSDDTGNLGKIGITQWQWMVQNMLGRPTEYPDYDNGQEQADERDRLQALAEQSKRTGETGSVRA